MKRATLIAGLFLLVVIWAGPLLGADSDSFTAHMLAHMGVVAIAAPLIAVGLQSLHFRPHFGFGSTPDGTCVVHTPTPNPSPQGGGGRHCRHLSQNLGSLTLDNSAAKSPSPLWGGVRGGGAFIPFSLPVLASVLELIVVWAWHAPALRAAAESSGLVTAAEQASFLAAGLFLWLACIGHGADNSAGRSAAGAFGLLLTSVHMTLLGALLALTPRPLYGVGEVTCLGFTLTAGQDQELGGVLMLLIGAAVYMAGGLALLARVLRADGQPGRA